MLLFGMIFKLQHVFFTQHCKSTRHIMIICPYHANITLLPAAIDVCLGIICI